MRSLLLLAAVLLLPGCLLDQPLTGPSRSVNTWMLGVWEYSQSNGERLQAVVIPKDSDRYTVHFREYGKNKKLKTAQEYDAWISRVGLVSFLTVEVDGRYCPIHFQLLSPLEVRLRLPDFDEGSESLPPFELRQQVRRKFKEGNLLGKEGQTWVKVSEVYWPLGGMAGDQPMDQPVRVAPVLAPKEVDGLARPTPMKVGL